MAVEVLRESHTAIAAIQQRRRSNSADSNNAGLRWYWQAAVFVAAAFIVLARRPGDVLNPQFWAEDGCIWFAQAYNLGWFNAIFIPYAGYLVTLPRLVASFALLVPFHVAPLLMNLAGMALQVLPVSFLLSSRSNGLAALPTRILWAITYVFLPNAVEVHVNLTNTQWHLALLACLVLLNAPPGTYVGKTYDAMVFIVSGLTGPFCIFLTCIGVFLSWRRPDPWRRMQLVLLFATSFIQIAVMLDPGPAERTHSLGANAELLVRIIAGHVYLGALFGSNLMAYFKPLSMLITVFCCGTVLLFYTAWKTSLETRLFIAFCLMTLAASLAKPVYSISYGKPAWPVLELAPGCRYWFIPTLAFVWCLAWCARSAPARLFRIAGRVLLAFMILGVIREYRYQPLKDEHFALWSYRFEHSNPGTYWEIPVPAGSRWTMHLWKR